MLQFNLMINNMMKFNLLLAILLIFVLSCTEEKAEIKYYFFQIDDLEVPKVYVYQNVTNPNDKLFYALKSIKVKSDKFLHYEVFDNNYNVIESCRMKINSSGAFAEEFVLNRDTTAFNMKIYSDTIMIWNTDLAHKFQFEASLNRPELTQQMTIKKVRKFINKADKYTFEKINYETVLLEEEVFLNDGNNSIDFTKSKVTYAKNLGIVEMIVSKNSQMPITYRLNSIINYSSWKNNIKVK